MSTAFFVDNGQQRIGIRAAAGLYCWDCRVTLRVGGESAVHTGGAYIMTHPFEQWKTERAKEWHNACPRCNNVSVKEDVSESSGGRELGFNKGTPGRKRGVQSCSLFTWKTDPRSLEGVDGYVDEYGRKYTPSEFAAVLEECPIRFPQRRERSYCPEQPGAAPAAP